MAVKLRTRLFLVVATLLGASIAVSALLSRRATLVEVQAIVHRGPTLEDPSPALDKVAAVVERSSADRMGDSLIGLEEELLRRVLVVDQAGAVVGASNPSLARASVKRLTDDGALVAEVGDGEKRGVIEIRGAPVRRVRGADGRPLTIVLLPHAEPSDALEPLVAGTPLWVWTTVATGIIAVPLVFALSRRILGPITALTDAAHRMQAGELDVRVEASGRDEVAELAQAFNQMAARLAENERLRKQMVSDVAHELRSPVTNLRCTLESIQDGLAIADRKAIDALHDETIFLQRLISDLEDLSRADAGQLAIRREPVDVGEAIRRAAAATIMPTDEIDLSLELPPDLPTVSGDSDRIEQVFRNLLSNAARHTRSGGRIVITAEAIGAALRIAVTDTGRGIANEHLAHVFDRFYRADESRARATGGAGLGLAIVRQLVLAHGGNVTAESAGEGHGASFVVTLPRA